MHFKPFLLVVIGRLNGDLPVNCRFKGVLGQVNQYLLEAYLISYEDFRQLFQSYTHRLLSRREGGLKIRQVLQGNKLERAVDHFHLRREHIQNKFEGVAWIEALDFRYKFVLVYQPKVLRVINDA